MIATAPSAQEGTSAGKIIRCKIKVRCPAARGTGLAKDRA
jgi:hypothetical protein